MTCESTEILVGQAHIEDDLEVVFRKLIDDATYHLQKDFNITKTPKEIAKIVIKAMEKYSNFK